jgi:tRNA G10  N-methylase Trm11
MVKTAQLHFFSELNLASPPSDWTFNGASTRELTHCFHDYPARMIPQIAGKLVDIYGIDAQLLFDPYCGTGTSLVEGMIRGINVIGTDLNPLARLIAKAKTTLLEPKIVDAHISAFAKCATRFKSDFSQGTPQIKGITRLDFWFKPAVIEKLLYIKQFIQELRDDALCSFFQVAFSETVRECSNTRNEEFKLYRYDEEKLKRFNPDVFAIMSHKLQRNRNGLVRFMLIMENLKGQPKSQIYEFDTVKGIPMDCLKPASVDIVITSPPYGDSHTTVAYGQYSRLSSAWLDFQEPEKIDRVLMGGTRAKQVEKIHSDSLQRALGQIDRQDKSRALEVASFYNDLQLSIRHVSDVIKPNGYACYVVGNRKVKGIVLPTDQIVRDMFESCGFEYIATYHRSIPNKRMPLRNSPTNAAGTTDSTMTQEYIVVMRRMPPRVHERRAKYKTQTSRTSKPTRTTRVRTSAR